MSDFHWAMQVIDDLDAGLIVLDKHFQCMCVEWLHAILQWHHLRYDPWQSYF